MVTIDMIDWVRGNSMCLFWCVNYNYNLITNNISQPYLKNSFVSAIHAWTQVNLWYTRKLDSPANPLVNSYPLRTRKLTQTCTHVKSRTHTNSFNLEIKTHNWSKGKLPGFIVKKKRNQLMPDICNSIYLISKNLN